MIDSVDQGFDLGCLPTHRTKVCESIPITTRKQRLLTLKKANYNLFQIASRDVTVDLLTDSGTAAMSAAQWGALIQGDEAYAGSRSFEQFQNTVQTLTGFEHVIPTHQGRAAERLLCSLLLKPGQYVLANHHFDTTRANVEMTGAIAMDLPCSEYQKDDPSAPFKGNIDLELLEQFLSQHAPSNIGFVLLTITDNSAGGQPVSLQNALEVSRLAKEHGVPLYLDAARFAENAWFSKKYDPSLARRSLTEIALSFFSLADGCLMSAKKNGLANIGGFLAIRDQEITDKLRELCTLWEGFPTYGGLAGRDLAAIAVGLEECIEEGILRGRIAQVHRLGNALVSHGFPVQTPFGGHAVFIDAARALPHLEPKDFPGHALACAFYLEGGIRTVEVGSLMLGRGIPDTPDFVPAEREWLRLAVPARVYGNDWCDYTALVGRNLLQNRSQIPPYRLIRSPERLRHFTATLAPEFRNVLPDVNECRVKGTPFVR
ncbi:MAG: tryptophanase [Planctomycetota bacterium]|nr:tryptophanase [Planctomycetota bacterium]